MYHQAISEKSVLKVDFQVVEKKIQRKEDKILNLESTLQKLREQNSQLKSILGQVKEQMAKKGGLRRMDPMASSSRVVKKIKGGGRRAEQATPRNADKKHKELLDAILKR